jgi:hypothetical protein
MRKIFHREKVTKVVSDLGTKFIEKIETHKGSFFSYHFRPKRSELVENSVPLTVTKRIGIVVQGPLVVENDFTLESLIILRNIFPQSKVLLSAWKSEDPHQLRKFEDNGFDILINTPPDNPGPSHINWQMYATLQGLQKLAADCDFLLKTRADQRIYAPESAGMLLSLIKAFPPASGFQQKGRIVSCSLNSFRYRPYDLSDMFIFGHTADVLRFWSAPLDPRPRSFVSQQPTTLRQLAGWNICEMYLTSKYLEGIGRDLKWTIEDSWRAWRDHFCVADTQSLNLFWYKYKRHQEHRYRSYGRYPLVEEVDFAFWMNLYGAENMDEMKFPEHYLDVPL